MKKILVLAALTLFFFSAHAPYGAAEKFSSISSDYMTKENTHGEIRAPQTKIPAPTAPSPSTVDNQPISPWGAVPATKTLSPTSAPTTTITELGPAGAPLIAPTMKSPTDIKKPVISVPDYEEKYKAMMSASVKAKAVKKQQKKLMDQIMTEVANYGIWIILGIVAFIVIFTIYKDKETDEKIAANEEAIKSEGVEKKNLWDDEF